MHELTITESIVTGVLEQIGDARVTRVFLEVGKLSGAVPEAIRGCFEVCAQGTALEGATLEIAEPEGRGRCRRCGREVAMRAFFELCPCGSAELELTDGQQLLVRAVEVI